LWLTDKLILLKERLSQYEMAFFHFDVDTEISKQRFGPQKPRRLTKLSYFTAYFCFKMIHYFGLPTGLWLSKKA
jgi:hypothetical protein